MPDDKRHVSDAFSVRRRFCVSTEAMAAVCTPGVWLAPWARRQKPSSHPYLL